MNNRLLLAVAALALLVVVGIGVVWAAQGQPKFPMSSVIGVSNDSAVPISVTVEFRSTDINGPVVYSTTRSIAANSVLVLDVATIAAIPQGFRGVVNVDSNSPARSELWLQGFSLPFAVHNWSTVPGTIDIRYIKAGIVALAYNNVPIGIDQVLRVTPGQYPPPSGGYDSILVASPLAGIEGYYSSGSLEIRKQ